jgi:uncharacterized protein DUF1592/uncharacterized protein DUF1588/uncharacterized protein DUF1587/uncharacterized protein DUF1585/uncharacterized protein DUF1595/cytochrome c
MHIGRTANIDARMNIRGIRAFAAGCVVFFALAGAGALVAEPKTDFEKQIVPMFNNYCYDCHGEGAKKGGLALDKYSSLDAHLNNTELWFSVWKNVQSQLMPPANKSQPKPEERERLLRWIERAVFKVDPANPDPGRVTIRRLNREEYRNTVLDLLGVKFDTDEAFPADDTGYGFDTIGDVLSISPLLMEKYVDAAEDVVHDAIEDAKPRIPTLSVGGENFRVGDAGKKTAKYLPFADPATASQVRRIERPGRYRITAEMSVRGSSDATSHTAKVALRVEDKVIETMNVGWDYRKTISLAGEAELKKGDNFLAIEIAPGNPPLENENQLNLSVLRVSIQGPLDGSHLEYPKDYYRVFLDGPPPADAKARTDYARKILRHFADRAFRRPVDEPMLDRLVALSEGIAKQPGSTFDRGIAHALTAILASPRFLFRAETQPEPNNAGRTVPIDEFALASRLSYFLWSSLPDDELLTLAREGKLRANLRAQVDRMLGDGRSQRLVSNFVGQWLQTRDVEGIHIDARHFLNVPFEEAQRIFNQRLRHAMRQETEMLFAHVLAENRSALDLLTADYTFLNEQLAAFYDIPGVKGTEMRKVALGPDSHRVGGILTHGSMLVVTSNPTRTSPVKRGLFILDNILGTPAPPAPPNVPDLEQSKKSGKQLTMRELMAVHREQALCASCHARMDPLGFALENFTPLGTWRDDDHGKPIMTEGQLITGEKFNDLTELAHVLATSRRDDFYRCLSEKLLTYAIGRGLEYYDTVTVDQIVDRLKADNGAMRSLIYAIVESAPFQKRRGDGERVATGK